MNEFTKKKILVVALKFDFFPFCLKLTSPSTYKYLYNMQSTVMFTVYPAFQYNSRIVMSRLATLLHSHRNVKYLLPKVLKVFNIKSN